MPPKERRRLSWPLAAGLCAGAAIAAAAPPAGAAQPIGRPNGPKTVETVFFSDRRLPPVKVIRGIVAPPAASGPGIATGIATAGRSVEIVSFPDAPAHSVKIVRGAASVPDAARRASTVEIVTFASGQSAVTIVRGASRDPSDLALFGPAGAIDLDRVAFAVDGAESSHGTNPAMWRPQWNGPQGPMQVSAAAALDVGGGDRFDLGQNRLLGRAYLARLFQRYGNWADAIAAYNWGPGNMDSWIAVGRPAERLPLETERYVARVLRDLLLSGPTLDTRLPAELARVM